MSETRRERWQHHETGTKLSLVVDDLDRFDDVIVDLRTELKGIKTILIGILVSTTTAAIMLAVNIGVGG